MEILKESPTNSDIVGATGVEILAETPISRGGIVDTISPSGMVEFVLRDEFGNIKQQFTTKNMVVTTGRNFIASRMNGTTPAVMSHMELGTSSTAAALGQTALVAAVVGSRTALTPSVTNNEITYSCLFNGSFTGALTEAGIFNAASAGTMLCRTVFSAINKAALDTLTITWKVTIT